MFYKFTQHDKIQALFSAGAGPTVWTHSLTDLATASLVASTCHSTGHAAQVASALLYRAFTPDVPAWSATPSRLGEWPAVRL